MSLTLAYWKIRGLAAPARMMLTYGGQDFEDKYYGVEGAADWHKEAKPAVKEKNALANLPYVEHDGEVITQSNAVLLYVGRVCKLNGATDKAAIGNEQILCQAFDLREETVKLIYATKKEEFEAKAKEFLAKAVQTQYGKLNGWLKQKGHKCFNAATPLSGDFHVWELMDQQELLAKHLGVDSPVAGHPELKAFYEAFRALPQLETYFASEMYSMPVNFLPYANWA